MSLQDDSKVFKNARDLEQFFIEQLRKWLPEFVPRDNGSNGIANKDNSNSLLGKRQRLTNDVTISQILDDDDDGDDVVMTWSLANYLSDNDDDAGGVDDVRAVVHDMVQQELDNIDDVIGNQMILADDDATAMITENEKDKVAKSLIGSTTSATVSAEEQVATAEDAINEIVAEF